MTSPEKVLDSKTWAFNCSASEIRCGRKAVRVRLDGGNFVNHGPGSPGHPPACVFTVEKLPKRAVHSNPTSHMETWPYCDTTKLLLSYISIIRNELRNVKLSSSGWQCVWPFLKRKNLWQHGYQYFYTHNAGLLTLSSLLKEFPGSFYKMLWIKIRTRWLQQDIINTLFRDYLGHHLWAIDYSLIESCLSFQLACKVY